jgi:hypothetical protein
MEHVPDGLQSSHPVQGATILPLSRNEVTSQWFCLNGSSAYCSNVSELPCGRGLPQMPMTLISISLEHILPAPDGRRQVASSGSNEESGRGPDEGPVYLPGAPAWKPAAPDGIRRTPSTACGRRVPVLAAADFRAPVEGSGRVCPPARTHSPPHRTRESCFPRW